ncbi:MAG: hypothetical protein AAGF95_16145 [Chloroflexota bacterium]
MQSVKEKLQSFVAKGNAAIAQGDADSWSQVMYAPDVIIIGEGMDTAVRGRDANLLLIRNLLASGAMDDSDLVVEFADGNDDFAYTFINFRRKKAVTPDEGARALYVLQHTEEGRRVVANMYPSGKFK